jgi:hypothetical protein
VKPADHDIEAEELDVPKQAVKALAEADRITRQAHLTQVLVRDGKLVEISSQGRIVRQIKPLKLRKRVQRRILTIDR